MYQSGAVAAVVKVAVYATKTKRGRKEGGKEKRRGREERRGTPDEGLREALEKPTPPRRRWRRKEEEEES